MVAQAVCERPAAAPAPPPVADAPVDEASDVDAAEEHVPVPGGTNMTYGKLRYKSSHMFGIRQKLLGKQQIFTVGGKRCGLSKEELNVIADRAIAKLESESTPEEAAKIWAKQEVDKMIH